jgi:hypothetical protein
MGESINCGEPRHRTQNPIEAKACRGHTDRTTNRIRDWETDRESRPWVNAWVSL